MFRFAFSIRTRSGQRVDNVSIMASSQPDAERRLRQMYRSCEIIDCHTNAVSNAASRRSETLDVESVIALISAEPAFVTGPAALRVGSRNKARLA